MEDTKTILHIIMTVVAFITFLGIVFWAYSKKRKSAFDAAANAPSPDAVRLTAPVCPLTLRTASVGVSSSCQLARVEAPAVLRMKLLFRSVRTATSPISAVRASIAA